MASVSAQSFERAMHHEATERLSLTTGASARESKGSSAPGEKPVDRFSDRGSIPLASTNLIAGRTPAAAVIALPYGFVLAAHLEDRL